MNERGKSIWKEHLPIHIFFCAIALIGLWKAHTFWGFLIFGISIGATGVMFFLEKKILTSKDRNKNGA